MNKWMAKTRKREHNPQTRAQKRNNNKQKNKLVSLSNRVGIDVKFDLEIADSLKMIHRTLQTNQLSLAAKKNNWPEWITRRDATRMIVRETVEIGKEIAR